MDKLTKNQTLVFERLRASKTHKSAYDLLDELRSEGLRAPLQVYRALDKLVDLDLVHRLESKNAFIACEHDHDHNHHCGFCAFQICNDCGTVNEVHDPDLTQQLKKQVDKTGFELTSATVEIRGRCPDCRKQAV